MARPFTPPALLIARPLREELLFGKPQKNIFRGRNNKRGGGERAWNTHYPMEDIQINKKEKILFNYYKELEPVSPVTTNPTQGKNTHGHAVNDHQRSHGQKGPET